MEKRVGRPKQEVIKDKIVSVRMNADEYDRFKKYADASNITISELMKEGMKVVIERYAK